MIPGRLGLTLPEVERLTGMEWLPFTPEDDYDGPGAYVWVSGHGKGETIYPGKSKYVVARLAAQAGWSEDADHVGYEAFSRLIYRYSCAAFYTRTTSEDEARDLEALVAAATVHLIGAPPLGWGLAWLPRNPRQIDAWDRSLRWLEQESDGASGQEVA